MESVNVEVQFYSNTIVRIIRLPDGISLNKKSLSAIKSPETTGLSVSEENNTIYLKSKDLLVALNLKTGSVTFSEIKGSPLFAEKESGFQFSTKKGVDENSYSVRQAFTLDQDEVIYGLGQQQNGKLNQRNQKLNLQQANTKVCIRFFQSMKGVGCFGIVIHRQRSTMIYRRPLLILK
ncbi:MAG: hypothetical protein ABIN91_01360 [Mucilaginibacter sp.]|uniref:hypothetical protein n=1 Tax=Mucilaginibacter sp. TaxID=1882438 RepID=UPI0032670B67